MEESSCIKGPIATTFIKSPRALITSPSSASKVFASTHGFGSASKFRMCSSKQGRTDAYGLFGNRMEGRSSYFNWGNPGNVKEVFDEIPSSVLKRPSWVFRYR